MQTLFKKGCIALGGLGGMQTLEKRLHSAEVTKRVCIAPTKLQISKFIATRMKISHLLIICIKN